MPKVMMFGDSITYGCFANACGWADKLKEHIGRKPMTMDKWWLVYNLGIPGDTTTGILQRFKVETDARKSDGINVIITLAIGTNDAVYIRSEKSFRTPLPLFKKNLEKIAKMAGKLSKNVVLLTMPPVDEGLIGPKLPDIPRHLSNKDIERYNKITKTIAKKHKFYLLDMYNELKKLNYKKLFSDGVHPNALGYKKMFAIVKRHLRKKKII